MIKGVLALLLTTLFSVHAYAQTAEQEQKVAAPNTKNKEFLGVFFIETEAY